jgi:putative membrane protein
MVRLCAAAGWPIVVRHGSTASLAPGERTGQLRAALADSLDVLSRGDVLVIFPEGYPTIDPGHTPKTHDDEVLPFEPGFAQLARLAVRQGIAVRVVPVGLAYRRGPRWSLTVTFGPPLVLDPGASPRQVAARVEGQVRLLSGLADNN